MKTAENVEKVVKSVRDIAESMKGNFLFDDFEQRVWEEVKWEGVMSEKALRILLSKISVEFDEADYEKQTGVKLSGLQWGNRNESENE